MRIRKYAARIAVGLLLCALILLGRVVYVQAEIIQYQRQVLRQAIAYVMTNCAPNTQRAEN